MFERFRTRTEKLERIDTGDYTPAEYARWQREMVFIHCWFGETRALRRTLADKVTTTTAILDVGAGSGELLNTLRELSVQNAQLLCGADIEFEAARTISERGFTPLICTGVELPFADDSFDHAVSSLVFHHLSSDVAVKVLREMMRVSRHEVFVFDLRRSVAAYFGYRLLAFFLFQKLTREDGSLSILRSYTDNELIEIGKKAGLRDVKVERSALFRLILSGKK